MTMLIQKCYAFQSLKSFVCLVIGGAAFGVNLGTVFWRNKWNKIYFRHWVIVWMIAFWGSLSDTGNFSNNSIQMWTYARRCYVPRISSRRPKIFPPTSRLPSSTTTHSTQSAPINGTIFGTPFWRFRKFLLLHTWAIWVPGLPFPLPRTKD